MNISAITQDKLVFFYKTLGKDTVHLTRYTGEKAIQFIKDTPEDKPFCLSISFSPPMRTTELPISISGMEGLLIYTKTW